MWETLYLTYTCTISKSYAAVMISRKITILTYAQVLKKFVRDFQKELCKDLKEESGDY